MAQAGSFNLINVNIVRIRHEKKKNKNKNAFCICVSAPKQPFAIPILNNSFCLGYNIETKRTKQHSCKPVTSSYREFIQSISKHKNKKQNKLSNNLNTENFNSNKCFFLFLFHYSKPALINCARARSSTTCLESFFHATNLDMDIGKYDGTNAGKIEH